MKDLRVLVLSFVLAVVLTSCSYPDDNFPGSEYMPDMAHSLAMEANTYNYYYYNTWDDVSTVKLSQLAYPRTTVKGAIPRGYAGEYIGNGEQADTVSQKDELMMAGKLEKGADADEFVKNTISVPVNGHVPYYFEDTPEGREQAIAQLVDNPFPITEAGLAKGANLYQIFCAICHGEAGNGLGYLYDDEANPNAAYPAAPASFVTPEFLAASNGRYYNAIYHGYNVMGSYKDKMSYEERWQVIHYIRVLQARDQGKEYTPQVNTLNAAFGTPGEPGEEDLAGAVSDDAEEMTAGGDAAAAEGQLKKK